MKEGMLSLRVSSKNGKDRPKILKIIGKTDKLIGEYLEDTEWLRNMKEKHFD